MIESLLAPPRMGRPVRDRRQVVDGLLRKLSTAAAQQTGGVVYGARGQRQAAPVDQGHGVPGMLIGFRHTIPTAAGGTLVTPCRACGPGEEVTLQTEVGALMRLVLGEDEYLMDVLARHRAAISAVHDGARDLAEQCVRTSMARLIELRLGTPDGARGPRPKEDPHGQRSSSGAFGGGS